MRNYGVLGIMPGASMAEIRQAYRDLVQVWHPDRFQGNPRLRKKAEESLKQINLAYNAIISSESYPNEKTKNAGNPESGRGKGSISRRTAGD